MANNEKPGDFARRVAKVFAEKLKKRFAEYEAYSYDPITENPDVYHDLVKEIDEVLQEWDQ